MVKEAEREWLTHNYTCPSAAGLRTAVHDKIARFWVALLVSAGWRNVRYEDRRWDAAAGSDEAKHRRPDITAIHPEKLQKWVFDVSVAWAPAAAGAKAGLAARGRERYKVSAYRDSMARRVEEAARGGAQVPEGWLDDKFVPLGFEAEGAWGPSSVWAFEEVLAVYAEIRDPTKTSGHLAVNFGAHWRKVIGAALADGAASVCLSSAMPDARVAERVSTEASQEFHPDCA